MNPMYKKYGVVVTVAVVIVGLLVWFVLSKSASSPKMENASIIPPSMTAEQGATPNTSCVPKTFDEAAFKKAAAPDGEFVTLTVKGFGNVKVKLSALDAPKTSENFKKLVSVGFYDCLSFHRIASGFVIQGGDPKGDGTGSPGFTVPAEIKLKHKRGSIAMARLPDPVNPKQDSSGSQFYIALQDLPSLDGEYTVFGEVVEGMDVVDKIAKVELIPAGVPDGPPKDAVVIEKAVVE